MFLYRNVRRVGSKSVYDFGICRENVAAQCRLPTNLATEHVKKSEVGTAQRNSIYKSRSHAKIDWCCFYYFARKGQVALLEALCARNLDPTLLYILISGTYSKFVRKNKMPALGVCLLHLLQPCPSAGPGPQVCRVKITFELLPTIRFVPRIRWIAL